MCKWLHSKNLFLASLKVCNYSMGLYTLMEPREGRGTNLIEMNELIEEKKERLRVVARTR